MKPLDHPVQIERRLTRWMAAARRTGEQSQRRRVEADFGFMYSGIEENLLPPFVYSYRRGLAKGRKYHNAAFSTKTVWQHPGDLFVTDNPVARHREQDRMATLFAAGAGLVAIAVRNTAARLIDWMDRRFRKAVGLPPRKPLGVGPGGVVPDGLILPVPVAVHRYMPRALPIIAPVNAPPLEFPVREAVTIVDDEIYALSQRAILEYARQTGAVELQWRTKEDEKVCPICSPLDLVKVAHGKPFGVYPTGEPIYNPPAHVSCRCKVRITKWKK